MNTSPMNTPGTPAELIDTHCHLDFPDFDADRAQVLAQCRARGIRRIVVPGVRAADWSRLRELCNQDDGLYPALGLHPMFLADHRDEDLQQLDGLLADTAVVAVGEIGLDFYHGHADEAAQFDYFETQLDLAVKHQLPVILHVRKAHDAVLARLRRRKLPGGVAHAFSGSRQQADQYLALGFRLGFGGMLTYERSRRLRELARALPREAIVLETDAPDMAVASHRGERNSPAYLGEVLSVLAEVRQEDEAEVARWTTANAEAVFRFDARRAGAA